jgi:PAS domain S-box-containing protein
MNPEQTPGEIAALIETLVETERRLELLTAGEVDSVTSQDGRTFLLRRAQEQLRHSDAKRQAAVLNALPAHIALLDAHGTIVSVNEAWRQFGGTNVLQYPGNDVGLNYLEICEKAEGEGAAGAHEVAAGIRAVLRGETESFSLEYPCHSPTEERWFRLRVVPANVDRQLGVVVMHLNITESKKGEDALRESEGRFRNMFTSAATGIAISTPQGRFLQANAAYCAMLGYTEDELRQRDFASVTHPDDLRLNLELRDALLAGQQESFVMEKRYLKKNGDTLWTRSSVSASHTAGGEIATLIVMAEDITERQQATEALQRQRSELRVLFDLMPARILFKDTENRILRANQRVAKFARLEIGQIEGRLASEIFPETSARRYADDLEVIRSRSPKLGIVELSHDPQGKEVWTQIDKVPYFDQAENVIGIVVMAQDITERKKAEMEVRLNEQRYRSLVEATTAIVWSTPASGEFEAAQPGWTAFTGQSFEQLRGWGWLNAVHPDDQAETTRVWKAAVAERRFYKVEHRLLAKDKTYHPMVVRAVPILTETGTIVEWIGIHTDVSEQKKMEEQYLRTQRMESIGALAGGIAHDLNNVLAPILMSIELLRLDTGDIARRNRILDTIQTSSRRAADLVRQVLTFARGTETQRVALRLRHVVADLEDMIGGTFPRNIRIVTDIASDLWPVMGNATQLHQVLLNLAVNARDAMPEGGTLTIKAGNLTIDDQYAATSNGAQAGTYVLLQVTDTGQGIPPEIQEHIFEAFFTTKKGSQGTGIGLATVQTVVAGHEGFLLFESEVGRGTTFKIHLPADPLLRTAATTQPFQTELPRGRDELVLVIDDELSIRNITKQTLEAFGYRVLTASDGAEAIGSYASQAQQIAIVITDMMMPIMDGAAFIQVIRRINPSIRIIAVSGIDSGDNVAKATNAGAHHFLVKPYTAESLLKLVRKALDQPAAP